MPYKVIADGAIDVLKAYGEVVDPYTGEAVAYEHGSEVYLPGDEIPDEDVSPVVRQAYEDGDEHIHSLLEKVSAKAEAKSSAPAKAKRKPAAKESAKDESDEGFEPVKAPSPANMRVLEQ